MCAWRLLPSTEAWKFINCNFEYQECLTATSSPGGQYPDCYLDGVLKGCAEYTSMSFEELGACATNSTSAGWMKTSGAATDKVAGGHPLWAYVDGSLVSDASVSIDDWGENMLTAICAAAKKQGLTLPAACQSNVSDEHSVTPI